MQVSGKAYQAKGLMVYGLAYGQEAAKELDEILAEGRLTKVLTQPYAKLKPIDQDALRIVPERIANSPNITVLQGSDKRTVILDVDASKFAPEIILHGSLSTLSLSSHNTPTIYLPKKPPPPLRSTVLPSNA